MVERFDFGTLQLTKFERLQGQKALEIKVLSPSQVAMLPLRQENVARTHPSQREKDDESNAQASGR